MFKFTLCMRVFPTVLRPRSVLLAAFCAALAASPATAAPILEFGPPEISTRAFFSSDVVLDSGTVTSPSDRQAFSSLIQPQEFRRFPASRSALPQGFVSASANADREAGVGVSGLVFRLQRAEAEVIYTQSVFNPDTQLETGLLKLDYVIPTLEVALLGERGFPRAELSASLTFTVFDASGSEVTSGFPFLYGLAITRNGNVTNTVVSFQLEQEQGKPEDGRFFTENGTSGVRYGTFDSTRELSSIPPGGRMDLTYRHLATGEAGAPEVGFQALIGDPFNISGGFELTLAGEPEPAPVPEPASVLLVPGALAGILLACRWRYQRLG